MTDIKYTNLTSSFFKKTFVTLQAATHYHDHERFACVRSDSNFGMEQLSSDDDGDSGDRGDTMLCVWPADYKWIELRTICVSFLQHEAVNDIAQIKFTKVTSYYSEYGHSRSEP
jgi:hypothetical protein